MAHVKHKKPAFANKIQTQIWRLNHEISKQKPSKKIHCTRHAPIQSKKGHLNFKKLPLINQKTKNNIKIKFLSRSEMNKKIILNLQRRPIFHYLLYLK
jgi:hypothetical protein